MSNNDKLFEEAQFIITQLRLAGATEVLLVGGYVRDRYIDIDSKDIDIEVYGMSYQEIINTLEPMYDVKLVGEAFYVLKVDNRFDITMPRRESKKGQGHTGFCVNADSNMPVKEAASRRDFTMNSIAIDKHGRYIDHFNGMLDIDNSTLRATSEAYADDPLRVLRGMKFASRFDMDMSFDTIIMSRAMGNEFHTISQERIYWEWLDWALRSIKPSKGLTVLRRTEWVEFFPELDALIGCEQDLKHHPEGDVWNHTLMVCDKMANWCNAYKMDNTEREVLMFAALCHDLGKPATTTHDDSGGIHSYGHPTAGIEPAKTLLRRIGVPNNVQDKVLPLVAEHLAHASVQKVTSRMVRRLATRLWPATIGMWQQLVLADMAGRGAHHPGSGKVYEVADKAENMQIVHDKPVQVVNGRHFIDLGYKPGPQFGIWLDWLYEAQLDGEFKTVNGGLDYWKDHWRSKKANNESQS